MFDEEYNITTGWHWLRFMDGDEICVKLERSILDANAHPIALEDVDGNQFNWLNIKSVKRSV